MTGRIFLLGCLSTLVLLGGEVSAASNPAADASTTDVDKMRAAYAQFADQNRLQAAEISQLRQQLNGVTTLANACMAKNDRLAAFAEDVLSDFYKIRLGQMVASREFVVGLARVRLENIMQDREDRIRANRCDPRTDSAPPLKASK